LLCTSQSWYPVLQRGSEITIEGGPL
jgi:hypothetical protein